MTKRPSKDTDQEMAQKAYIMLGQFMRDNHEIEPTLWYGAFWSALVNGYLESDIPFEQFSEEIDIAREHYRKIWFGA